MQTITLSCALQLGSSNLCVLLFISVLSMFFFSIWEQYYTGILRFSKISGPTEALFYVIILQLITGVFGVQFWTQKLFNFIPFNYIVTVPVVLLTIPTIITNIKESLKSELSKEELEMKGSKIMATLPFLLTLSSWVIWIYFSKENILQKQPLICYSIFGFISGFVITRLVISRVCNENPSYFYFILLPFPIIALKNLFNIGTHLITDTQISIFYSFYIFICYSHMIYEVIWTFSEALNIRVFFVKPPQ